MPKVHKLYIVFSRCTLCTIYNVIVPHTIELLAFIKAIYNKIVRLNLLR